MLIDDDLRRALLHEAGHAVAYHILGHQSGGIAVCREGVFFLNLVASNSPKIGDAAGSAAEVLLLGKYDPSGARADQTGLALSDGEYNQLVERSVSFLSPHKRVLRRIQSLLLSRLRPVQSLDDLPAITGATGGMQLPQDGRSYSLILSPEEISNAVATG